MKTDDDMVEVEVEIPNELYDWILEQVKEVENVEPFLAQAVKDFIIQQSEEEILKNATVYSIGC